jgi:hypothetical protein
VWDTTKEQRCWVHKLANILDKLPKGSQPQAKRMRLMSGNGWLATFGDQADRLK